jgi:DNA-binding response OmpR family regulator
MRGKILIIEDEKKIAEVMMLYLKNEGYDVKTADDGAKGEEALDEGEYDLIILDIMMPKKDGWSLLRKIKNQGDTPVIITTARGEEEDRIFGFELGAVDYMVKPISMKELIFRVGLRINKYPNGKETNLSFENMIISENNRTVNESDLEINLTPKEFDLLIFLCKNQEQVFKRDQLLQQVWGYDFMGDTRTVDTHIKNLREKIEYCSRHIKTVWGVGYKMQARV